jgi:hypothetical protein
MALVVAATIALVMVMPCTASLNDEVVGPMFNTFVTETPAQSSAKHGMLRKFVQDNARSPAEDELRLSVGSEYLCQYDSEEKFGQTADAYDDEAGLNDPSGKAKGFRSLKEKFRNQILEEHNAWRREVGVPDIEWDFELESKADLEIKVSIGQTSAPGTCKYTPKVYGEFDQFPSHITNFARGSCKSEFDAQGCRDNGFSPKEMMKGWTRNRAFWNYGPFDNACTKDNGGANSYARVVARQNTKIGCRIARCGEQIPGSLIINVPNRRAVTPSYEQGDEFDQLMICHYSGTAQDEHGLFPGELPFCPANKPDNMDSCSNNQLQLSTNIDQLYEANACNHGAGKCSPGQCCSCTGCGQGAADVGAPFTQAELPPATGWKDAPCATEEFQRCETSYCCTGRSASWEQEGKLTVCMEAAPGFAMCLAPKYKWTFCPGGPHWDGTWDCNVMSVSDDGTEVIPARWVHNNMTAGERWDEYGMLIKPYPLDNTQY